MLQNGYGTFGVPTVDPHRHRTVLVHRYSYELFVGPIPRSLVIDHMCRVRHCVNPDHLRIVTRRINNLQNTVSHVALNPDKTHCPVGHLYDEENTYVSKRGYRQCRPATCGLPVPTPSVRWQTHRGHTGNTQHMHGPASARASRLGP